MSHCTPSVMAVECAACFPYSGCLEEALDLVFAFTEHIPLRGHECHMLAAHNLEVGSSTGCDHGAWKGPDLGA